VAWPRQCRNISSPSSTRHLRPIPAKPQTIRIDVLNEEMETAGGRFFCWRSRIAQPRKIAPARAERKHRCHGRPVPRSQGVRRRLLDPQLRQHGLSRCVGQESWRRLPDAHRDPCLPRNAVRVTAKKSSQPCRNPPPPFVAVVKADQTTPPNSVQEKNDAALCDFWIPSPEL
jgi:hypothetical protein